jgi:hypothetical protein
MAETAPVAVWDVHDRGWQYAREAKSRWLREQGLPADRMFRVEFFLIDMPCARISCYALNGAGARYRDGSRAATEPPRMVALTGLPPRELLEVT